MGQQFSVFHNQNLVILANQLAGKIVRDENNRLLLEFQRLLFDFVGVLDLQCGHHLVKNKGIYGFQQAPGNLNAPLLTAGNVAAFVSDLAVQIQTNLRRIYRMGKFRLIHRPKQGDVFPNGAGEKIDVLLNDSDVVS